MSVRECLDRGWFVFPMAHDAKKFIAGLSWKEASTNNAADVAAFSKKYPDCNWGIDCGKSNLIVIDVDVKKVNGEAALFGLELDYGDLPPTFEVRTPSGGRHLYFTGEGPTTAGKTPGIDTRGLGGLVLAPGSTVAGIPYVMDNDFMPAAPAPDWFDTAFGPARESQDTLKKESVVTPDEPRNVEWALRYLREEAIPATQGEAGDARTFETAAKLRDLGLTMTTTFALMLSEYNHKCLPPWPAHELMRKVENAYKYAKGTPGAASPLACFDEVKDDAPADMPAPKASGVIAELNERHAFATVGGRAVVIDERDSTHPSFLSVNAFEAKYANRKVQVGETTKGEPKYKPLGRYWIEHPLRRQYENVAFLPGRGALETKNNYNLWRGFSVAPARGAFELYKKHVDEIVCGGDRALSRYVWSWMADAVQNPGGAKPGVALVLQGGRGVGKDAFIGPFVSLFGPHGSTIHNRDHLTGRFNAHLAEAIVAYFNEAFWAGDKKHEGVLKGLITERDCVIERKGFDVIKSKSYLRVVMASNEDWVVPASSDERRFCVLQIRNAHAKDPAYFAPLFAEMRNGGKAALLDFLQNYDIAGIDLRNPPMTEGLAAQQSASLSSEDAWMHDILVEGGIGGEEWQDGGYVKTETIWSSYSLHVKETRGFVREKRSFMKHILKYMPGSTRHRVKAESDLVGRAWCYRLPPLAECRAAFAAVHSWFDVGADEF